VKSGFPKILDFFMDFQGFPTPWISHPMDFGFSGRPRERPIFRFSDLLFESYTFLRDMFEKYGCEISRNR